MQGLTTPSENLEMSNYTCNKQSEREKLRVEEEAECRMRTYLWQQGQGQPGSRHGHSVISLPTVYTGYVSHVDSHLLQNYLIKRNGECSQHAHQGSGGVWHLQRTTRRLGSWGQLSLRWKVSVQEDKGKA